MSHLIICWSSTVDEVTSKKKVKKLTFRITRKNDKSSSTVLDQYITRQLIAENKNT